MTATPLVSCLVLNYRTPKVAEVCVRALLQQTIADRCEILVIDNHSNDDSIGYLRNRFSATANVRIVETPRNLGFGSGYNLGFNYAQGAFLLLNNPAKILEPDALKNMVATMEHDSTIGILAPKLIHDDGTIRDSYRSFPTFFDVIVKRTPLRHVFHEHMRNYLQQNRDPATTGDTDWVVGGCLMIRADLCRELGGFDERFFLFFEDTDLCRRCWNAGKRVVYFPLAHGTDRKSRLSEGGLWSLLRTRAGREHIKSACKYFWKWGKTQPIGSKESY